MKKIYILATAVAILLTIFLAIKGVVSRNGELIPFPSASPISSPNAPKTFKFDSSTDLKEELEKVNPQILDSDFEELDK